MYEQPRPSIIGRIIWFIVSLLMIIGLIWLILWLLFWRKPTTTAVKEKAQETTSKVKQTVQSNGEGNERVKTETTQKAATTNGSGGASTATPAAQGEKKSTTGSTGNATNDNKSTASTATKNNPTTLPGNGLANDEEGGDDEGAAEPAVTAARPTANSGNLANTGPADNFAIVGAVVVGSTLAHYVVTNRRKHTLSTYEN